MNTTQKRSFGHRINEWLAEPEGEIFSRGKWRFWFPAVICFAIINPLLTAVIFGTGGDLQNFMGAILLAVGAMVAWLCLGALHYSDGHDRKLARGVSALDSVTLLFVAAHFCFLVWAYGHLITIQAAERKYELAAATYNAKAEKISEDNAKISADARQIAIENRKAEKLRNDTAYQQRKMVEAGGRLPGGRSAPAGIAPSLSTAPIELQKPVPPAESSVAFLTRWDAWIRILNFGELALALATLIFIRNRSAKTNAPRENSLGAFSLGAFEPRENSLGVRTPALQPRFDGEASPARQFASPESGEASPDGLRELQEVCSLISYRHPGRWYAVDLRGDHVRVRLRTRVEGREVTLKTARLTLEVLQDVLTMERSAFRERLEQFLKKRGFEL